ncbi:hypothetical protein D3C80_1672960 [compost metagenome]
MLLGIGELSSQAFGQFRRLFCQALHQLVDVIVLENIHQVIADHFVQVRGNDACTVDDLVAQVQRPAFL